MRGALTLPLVTALGLIIGGTADAPLGPPTLPRGVAQAAAPSSPCISNCSEVLASAEQGWTLEVFRSFPMSGSDDVTRAIVVVHGTGRNAEGYFERVMRGAERAGVADKTLVVSPWFKAEEDKPEESGATWTSAGWKIGDEAVAPENGPSSFLVMDQILTTLAAKDRFPNLAHVTLVGHSAGGQLVQRYAALGLAPNSLDVSITYVPINPSSFLYLDANRPTGGGEFKVPESKDCPDYDTYKYGLTDRTGYAAQLEPEQAITNYASRRVIVMNGAEDKVQNGNMDTDCGAMVQGANRAGRGANYAEYVKRLAPNASHSYVTIPGLAHESDQIFVSPTAGAILFQSDDVEPRPGP